MSIHLTAAMSAFVLSVAATQADEPGQLGARWKRHTIDRSSKGADGVRMGDVDKDGKRDIVTGWEEGGRIRICFQPKTSDVRKLWPSIEIGRVKSPEDAVFVDVNRDGWLDVVSSCEGKQQAVFFHLNPGDANQVRTATAWKTNVVPTTEKLSRWMFCEPLKATQLVLGSKEPNGQISLLNLDQDGWPLQKLRSAGWIMSLRTFDVDRDGDLDIVYSDRKGDHCQVGWLEDDSKGTWADHRIGGAGQEVMFMDIQTVNGETVLACNTRKQHVMILTPGDNVKSEWQLQRIDHPVNSGAGKAVAIGDINSDGRFDMVCTCGLAEGKFGAYWLRQPEGSSSANRPSWEFHDISGTEVGVKFDRIELLDLDHDGDLDLLTCEERHNLGVVWYENPTATSSENSTR